MKSLNQQITEQDLSATKREQIRLKYKYGKLSYEDAKRQLIESTEWYNEPTAESTLERWYNEKKDVNEVEKLKDMTSHG